MDVVLRDWLFEEMFEGQDPANALKPQFCDIVAADNARAALILNPLTERLLFSKEILACLRGQLAPADGELRTFCEDILAPTELLGESPPGGRWPKVVKPASRYGGMDVQFVACPAALTAAVPPDRRLPGEAWVVQPVLEGEEVIDEHCSYGPEARTLYVVHGLIVHGFGRMHRTTRVLTRIGPDRVVNRCRGAGIIGCLLE